MRKAFWLILIYLNFLIGCTVTKVENIHRQGLKDNNRDITVVLVDSTEIYFKQYMYRYDPDKIVGNSYIEGSPETPIKEIPVENIAYIKATVSNVNWPVVIPITALLIIWVNYTIVNSKIKGGIL